MLRLGPPAASTARTLSRTTFCYPGSVFEPRDFGAAAKLSALVALAEADDKDPLVDYIEAHRSGRPPPRRRSPRPRPVLPRHPDSDRGAEAALPDRVARLLRPDHGRTAPPPRVPRPRVRGPRRIPTRLSALARPDGQSSAETNRWASACVRPVSVQTRSCASTERPSRRSRMNAVGKGFAAALRVAALQVVPEDPPENPGRSSRWGFRQGAMAALDDRQYSAQHGNHDKNAQKAEREP